MIRPFALLGPAVTALLLTAACTSSTPVAYPPTSSPTQAAVSPSPAAVSPAPVAGAEISVANTRLGQILVDSKGISLYLFLADSATSSACNSAACVQYWPPVVTTGRPIAGGGVNESLLGTITRRDGTLQVTYAGHPLYYFITDKKPGDVAGQGINGFGALWYVVSPSGMQIR